MGYWVLCAWILAAVAAREEATTAVEPPTPEPPFFQQFKGFKGSRKSMGTLDLAGVGSLVYISLGASALVYANILAGIVKRKLQALFFVQCSFQDAETVEDLRRYAGRMASRAVRAEDQSSTSWASLVNRVLVCRSEMEVTTEANEAKLLLDAKDGSVESHTLVVDGAPPLTVSIFASEADQSSWFVDDSLPFWRLPLVWVTYCDRPNPLWSAVPAPLQSLLASAVPPSLRNLLKLKPTREVDPKESVDNNDDDNENTGVAVFVFRWNAELLQRSVIEAYRHAMRLRTLSCTILQPVLEDDEQSLAGSWKSTKGPPRAMETVVLGSEGQELMQDITSFRGRRQWYLERDLTYQRAFLLHGPPGNGKTSFLSALSIHLSLRLFILKVSSSKLTRTMLDKLLKETVKEPCVLVIEDAESAFKESTSEAATAAKTAAGVFGSEGLKKKSSKQPLRHREIQQDAGSPAIDDGDEGRSEEPPLSAAEFVEAVAGTLVEQVDGRLIFLTTNHEQALPPPLLRLVDESGRRCYFGNASKKAMRRLWRSFYRQPDLVDVRDQALKDFQAAFTKHFGEKEFSHAAMQGSLVL